MNVCWHSVILERCAQSCRIIGKMCRNIQALVHTFVLTPASCPERVCRHGKSVFGSSVNSLLIDHKVHVSRMFEMSPRDLWQSWIWPAACSVRNFSDLNAAKVSLEVFLWSLESGLVWWDVTTKLVTVVEAKLRCFCDRLSLVFLVGWFLDLKTAGKIPAHYSACASSGQGPKQRVLSGIFRI